jgi:dihydrofolate reductase
MKKILMAAIARNGVIGRTSKLCPNCDATRNCPACGGVGRVACNELPWPPRTYPEDMKRFREMTTNQAVVYGRHTFESFPGQKPLPNRENIVVSTTMSCVLVPDVKNLSLARDLDGAIACAKTIGVEKCFLIGGVRIFEEGLKIADELELTLVDRAWEGNVKFPRRFVRIPVMCTLDDGKPSEVAMYQPNKFPKKAGMSFTQVLDWHSANPPISFDLVAREVCATNPELTFTTWARR